MASIRKNKNGTYTATVYLGRDEKGGQVRKYVTRQGLKEVKQAARDIELDNIDLADVAYMPFSAYADRWFNMNRSRLAPTTIRSYKIYIDSHFKPHFNKRQIYRITDLQLKEYFAEKLQTLKGTTVRKHYFILQSMFRDALKHKSPFIHLKPPEMSDFKPTIPTEKEFAQIARHFAAIGKEWEAVILLAGWCGLRRGEIFALKWDDITGDKIRIDETLALKEEGHEWELKKPKSKKGLRVVTAPDALINLLEDIRTSRDILGVNIVTLHPDKLRSRYERARDSKKIPDYRFHDLRHYSASVMYHAGIPDQYAAERLGHDISVLKAKYQHLGLTERRNLDSKVKGIFDRSVPHKKRTTSKKNR